jgi:ribose 5-phosphate isomerase RpiB
MRIAVGSDHRGFALKEGLKGLLGELGHEWVDFGCQSEEAVDYPDIARPLAQAVGVGPCETAGASVRGTPCRTRHASPQRFRPAS